jgi:hypothetical protein
VRCAVQQRSSRTRRPAPGQSADLPSCTIRLNTLIYIEGVVGPIYMNARSAWGHACNDPLLGSSSDQEKEGVIKIFERLVAEVGQTVRAALESWPRTVRLVILITVLVGAAVIWTHYRL